VDLHFVAPDLRRIDDLMAEAVAVSCCSDERPPAGIAGLLDWRLCGQVSSLLGRGFFSGAPGERCLLSGQPRLPFEKVFLFGVGPRALLSGSGTSAGPRAASSAPTSVAPGGADARFLEVCRDMLETLGQARVRVAALALPGRHLGLVDPGRAMRLFLEVSATARTTLEELTLIDVADAQRAMRIVIDEVRRRDRG
jgi:hypothetical protein